MNYFFFFLQHIQLNNYERNISEYFIPQLFYSVAELTLLLNIHH